LYTSDTEPAKLLYISTEARLGITVSNEFQCFVLIKVTSKNIILEDSYIKITSKWYVYSTIKTKKTVRVHRLLAICRDMFCSGSIAKQIS